MTVLFEIVGVDGLKVPCRSAGHLGAPAVLRQHGLQSSSHTFHDLIPDPVGMCCIVAPDTPGFGITKQPIRDPLANSFNDVAGVVGRCTEVLGLERFPFHVFDHCASVGSRRA